MCLTSMAAMNASLTVPYMSTFRLLHPYCDFQVMKLKLDVKIYLVHTIQTFLFFALAYCSDIEGYLHFY